MLFRSDLAAVLNEEASPIDFLFHPHAFQRIGTGRQHGLADSKPGKFLLLQDHDSAAISGQQRAGCASGRPAADNRHVK